MNSGSRRAVYLRDDQWDLVDAALRAAAVAINYNLRVTVLQSATELALAWSVERIEEIRTAITKPTDEA